MNVFWGAIKISFKNLLGAKFRSFLSILGIIIGVSSVIIIFSTGKSAQRLILSQIEEMGSNLIAVLPGASDESGPPPAAFGISITTLTADDLEVLLDKKKLPEIISGVGYVNAQSSVVYQEKDEVYSLVGVSADYLNVENAALVSGRFFTKDENNKQSRIAIIGSSVASDFFNGENPLGKKIKIKNQNFLIVGVFKERTASIGSNQDKGVFVPLKTAQKQILGINHLGFIRLKARDGNSVELAIEKIKKILRQRHDIKNNEDDFSVRNQMATLKTIENLTDALRYFVLGIGSVSLLVGGVGIMNIMLISVSQRIREVGLRKALGAKTSDVLIQFLLESLVISFSGGMAGVFLGAFISFFVAKIVQANGYNNWEFLISKESIIVAVTISFFVGVFFGIYPAKKASAISPVEALKHE